MLSEVRGSCRVTGQRPSFRQEQIELQNYSSALYFIFQNSFRFHSSILYLHSFVNMYLSFGMISHPQSYFDKDSQENSRKIQSSKHKQPASETRFEQRYLDSVLTKEGHLKNLQIKPKIKAGLFDIVVVSPLSRCLETALDLFGDVKNIQIYVEPLLSARLDSAAALPNTANLNHLLTKFACQIDQSKIQVNQFWYLQKLSEVPNFQNDSAVVETRLKEMTKGEIESNKDFQKRIEQLKKELLSYHSKSKSKILLISHQEVLEWLTATGFQEDSTPINKAEFEGEIKQEWIILEEIEGELISTPFCSCT